MAHCTHEWNNLSGFYCRLEAFLFCRSMLSGTFTALRTSLLRTLDQRIFCCFMAQSNCSEILQLPNNLSANSKNFLAFCKALLHHRTCHKLMGGRPPIALSYRMYGSFCIIQHASVRARGFIQPGTVPRPVDHLGRLTLRHQPIPKHRTGHQKQNGTKEKKVKKHKIIRTSDQCATVVSVIIIIQIFPPLFPPGEMHFFLKVKSMAYWSDSSEKGRSSACVPYESLTG